MSTLVYVLGSVGFLCLIVTVFVVAANIAGADADRMIDAMLGRASSGDQLGARVLSADDELAPAERRRA